MSINISDTNTLCGRKATKALKSYIRKIKKQKNNELTQNQKEALIKTASVIKATIEQSEGYPHRFAWLFPMKH